jgi:hypothetical protein
MKARLLPSRTSVAHSRLQSVSGLRTVMMRGVQGLVMSLREIICRTSLTFDNSDIFLLDVTYRICGRRVFVLVPRGGKETGLYGLNPSQTSLLGRFPAQLQQQRKFPIFPQML